MARTTDKRLTIAALWLAVATAASLAVARPGLVTSTDRQQYEGEVTETDDSVRIERKGLSTTLTRQAVASIDYSAYPERFETALSRLPVDDVEGRVALARQAFDRGEYALAQRAVGAALDIDPLDRDARRLNVVIGRQLAMATGSATRATTTTPAAAGPSESSAPTPRRRLIGLNEDQINAVRQGELRQNDRVRIRFADNVRKRFTDAQTGMTFQQFNTFSDTEQALAILNRGTPEQVDDVRVLSDPASIQNYTRRINGPILQGCATSLCHGGEHAGAFRLISGVPDAATAITNFYLLTTHTQPGTATPGNLFGGGEREMVARGRAMDSLLVQYALPRALAKTKHPIVRGWDGIARSVDDRVIREIVQWIDLDLSPFRPDYGFRFELGRSETNAREAAAAPTTVPAQPADATQPAAAAATAPAAEPATP